MTPEFLTVEDVLELHALQLGRYGGGTGLRDQGLLASAVAQPMATGGGEFLHPDLWSMAAAYLFHIVMNHPFVDGNKRTGLLSALAFLDINGITIEHSSQALYEATMSVAKGEMTKPEFATLLSDLSGLQQPPP